MRATRRRKTTFVLRGPGRAATTVRGRIAESRISVVDVTANRVDAVHLNSHLDFSLPQGAAVAPATKAKSLAQPTALAFSTWAYALSRMPAGQLGITTYVVPPIAIILGLIIFAEVPAPLAIVGGAICLVGVALSRIRPRAVVDAPVVPSSAQNVAE